MIQSDNTFIETITRIAKEAAVASRDAHDGTLVPAIEAYDFIRGVYADDMSDNTYYMLPTEMPLLFQEVYERE